VALGGYQTANYFFAPRPTLHPNVDPGDSRVGVEKPLSIDLQVELNPNVTGGQYAVDTPETSFTKSERSSDG